MSSTASSSSDHGLHDAPDDGPGPPRPCDDSPMMGGISVATSAIRRPSTAHTMMSQVSPAALATDNGGGGDSRWEWGGVRRVKGAGEGAVWLREVGRPLVAVGRERESEERQESDEMEILPSSLSLSREFNSLPQVVPYCNKRCNLRIFLTADFIAFRPAAKRANFYNWESDNQKYPIELLCTTIIWEFTTK